MASFDFFDLLGGSILAHARRPVYQVQAGVVKNVVYSETPGGKGRSQVRGPDRRRLTLQWRRITAAHLAAFLAWHQSYGGRQQAFLIELPEDLTDVPPGVMLRVRTPQKELEYRWIALGRYDVVVELIEDLALAILLDGSVIASVTAVAALTTALPLTAAASAAAAAAAALTTAVTLLGAVTGSGSAAAPLTTALPLEGIAAGTAAATGDLTALG